MPVDYFAQQFGEDTFEDTAPAVSDAEILAYVQANINNPAAIAEAAAAAGVSMADLSRATGFSVADIGGYFGNAGVEPPVTPTSAPVERTNVEPPPAATVEVAAVAATIVYV